MKNSISVVSAKATALRETVGGLRFLCPLLRPRSHRRSDKKSFRNSSRYRRSVRKRIEELYSIGKKEEKLLAAIKEVLSG